MYVRMGCVRLRMWGSWCFACWRTILWHCVSKRSAWAF